MIEFECSECGKQLHVKDDAAGKKGKCPQCGTMLRVPDSNPALPHELATSGQASRSAQEHPSIQSAGDLSHHAEPSETRQDAEPVVGDGSDQHLDQPIKIAMAAGGIGLLILALSPLFKWVNFGTGGVTGISGDGKIVLGITIVSAIAFAIAVFTHKRIAEASLVVGAWGTVALFWMGGLIWKVGSLLNSPDVQDNPFAAILASQVSPGTGLYLGLVGGLVVAGALGFVAYRHSQLADRSRLFYIAQSCALALGVIIAVLMVTS